MEQTTHITPYIILNLYSTQKQNLVLAKLYRSYIDDLIKLQTNEPFHATLEGIQLHGNEIASFSGVHCNAIFGVKCIELTGYFSIFEGSLYCNYVEFSNNLNSIIRANFVLFNCPNRLHI